MHPEQTELGQASGAQSSVLWRTVCLSNSTVWGLESPLGEKNSLRKKEETRKGKTLSSIQIKGKMIGSRESTKDGARRGQEERKLDSASLYGNRKISGSFTMPRHQPGVCSWEEHLNN